MNGVHDMSGMDGFGPVVPEANEPVFHAAWERRTFGVMMRALGALNGNVDEFRHAIERMPPARYLASSYYERWLSALELLLVEHGLVTREELLAHQDRSAEVDLDQIARAAATSGPAPVAEKPGAKPPRARYAIGARVRARNINPSGHTRLPRYVRGKAGVIARDWGVFVFPDTNAHLAGTKPQHCYSVAFDAREMWGKPASSRERVYVDLWEDYLEAIGPKPRPAQAKSRPGKRGTLKRGKK